MIEISLERGRLEDKVQKIIHVKGSLVYTTHEMDFQKFCLDFIERNKENVVLYLDISSSASSPLITSLLRIHKKCNSYGISFDIVCPKERNNIYDALDTCGITQIMHVRKQNYQIL